MLCMVSTSTGLSACPDYARRQGWLKASPPTPVTPVGRVRWGGLRGFSGEVAHHASFARGYKLGAARFGIVPLTGLSMSQLGHGVNQYSHVARVRSTTV